MTPDLTGTNKLLSNSDRRNQGIREEVTKGARNLHLKGDWVENQFTLPTQVYRYKANQVESKERFSGTPAQNRTIQLHVHR